MKIKRTQWRHLPHGLGQHPEGDYDKQLCLKRPQLVDKGLVLETHGL